MSVSGKQFVFPRCCACCGGFPLVTLSISGSEKNRLSRTKGWTFEVPFCVECRAHVRRTELVLLVWVICVALGGLLGFGLFAFGRPVSGSVSVAGVPVLVSTLVCFGILHLARRNLPRDCSGLTRAVAYIGSVGVCHSFDIRSQSYAKEFILANHRKIVNASPQVANVLRGLTFGDSQTPRRIIRHR